MGTSAKGGEGKNLRLTRRHPRSNRSHTQATFLLKKLTAQQRPFSWPSAGRILGSMPDVPVICTRPTVANKRRHQDSGAMTSQQQNRHNRTQRGTGDNLKHYQTEKPRRWRVEAFND